MGFVVKRNAARIKQMHTRSNKWIEHIRRASNDCLALHLEAYASICVFPGESELRFRSEREAVKWGCCVRSGQVCKSYGASLGSSPPDSVLRVLLGLQHVS